MRGRYTNDYELIYLVMQGDDDALEEIINKYKGMMLKSLEQYEFILRDKFDRHELYQISLISLHHAIMTYNENMECSFSTYLRIVVHRSILMYIRKESGAHNKANLYAISLDQTIKDCEGIYLIETLENKRKEYNPKDSLEFKQMEIIINKQLQTFEKEEAEIFTLWRNGYTYEEIGTLYGLSIKKVGYILSKIRNKLKGSIDYKDTL